MNHKTTRDYGAVCIAHMRDSKLPYMRAIAAHLMQQAVIIDLLTAIFVEQADLRPDQNKAELAEAISHHLKFAEENV